MNDPMSAWTWAWRGHFEANPSRIVIVIIHPHLLRAVITARLFWSSIRHGWMRAFCVTYAVGAWRRLRRRLDKASDSA